jgi:hypothetical protein
MPTRTAGNLSLEGQLIPVRSNVRSRRCEQIAEPHSAPGYMTRAWRASGGTQAYITQAPLCRILGSLIGRRWSWWKRRALMRQWASCRSDPNAPSEMAKPGAPPAGGLKQTAQAWKRVYARCARFSLLPVLSLLKQFPGPAYSRRLLLGKRILIALLVVVSKSGEHGAKAPARPAKRLCQEAHGCS